MNESSSQYALFEAVRASILAQRNMPFIKRVERDAPLLASFAQQRLWFVEQLDQKNAQHNLCVAFDLCGYLNQPALEQALNTMIQRHESLRTTFKWQGNQLWQILATEDIAISLPVAVIEDETTLIEMAHQEASLAFDIGQAPLLRGRLFKRNNQRHLLLLTFHHLAFDGWSFEVFMREFSVLYDAFSSGLPNPLPEMSIQYVDFAIWQRQWLKGRVLEDLQYYWLNKMANPPAPLTLSSMPKNVTARGRGACQTFEFDTQLSQLCKQCADTEGLTVFMFLLSAFKILLFRLSGESDIIVGVPVANRNRKELEGLIGLLVNTLPLRTQINVDMTARDLMREVQQTVLDAYKHQDFLFELLIEALRLPRKIDRPPLLQVMFSFLNVPQTAWSFSGLEVECWNVHNGYARFDLCFNVWEKNGCFCGEIEYDCELFDQSAIKRLIQQWQTLLQSMIATPEQQVCSLPLLTRAEVKEILAYSVGDKTDYPRHLPVHRLFEIIVQQYPNQVVLHHEAFRYQELNKRANQLAGFFMTQGIKQGDLIAVCLPASVEFIITVLAVLKLGAAFMPLDESEPILRIQAALRGATVAAVICNQRDVFNGLSKLNFVITHIITELSKYREDNLELGVDANDLAYVMFTSGSTGVPKAVCIPHRGITRLACAANYAQLSSAEIMLLLAPLAFDASTFELWGALLNGAKLVIPTSVRPSLSDIAGLIQQHKITTLWLTSGLFELMMDAKADVLGQVKQLLVGGDVMSRIHAERYLRLEKHGQLINCYGPTENTTFSTFHPVSLDDVIANIPIGKPLNHSAVYVLDTELKLLPFGVVGDAWVAGDGLMLGYLNNEAANSENLLPDPFSSETKARMYRTGDKMKMYANGDLVFIARQDRQVKIRGYRVEPDEIETVLLADQRVANVCVIAEQHSHLIAYIVKSSVCNVADKQLIADLQALLHAKLPEPLRPSNLVFLSELPLNQHGKLDYAALQGETKPFISDELPQNAIEQKIAELFAKVLQSETLGRHDSFFEQGGHSLLALSLLERLETEFDVKLPVASVFEHHTPVSMANYIATLSLPRLTPIPYLAELKCGSLTPALFIVPGGRGGMVEMTLYARMVRYLPYQMAVFGLLADETRPLPDSVKEMAAIYIRRLKILQPFPPYLLAGECVGGVIAYEMAQQLQRAGETVFLVLFDSWCPSLQRYQQYLRYKLPLYWQQRYSELQLASKDFCHALIQQIIERPKISWSITLLHFYCIIKSQINIAKAWYQQLSNIRYHEALGDNYIKQAMRYHPVNSTVPINLLVSEQNQSLGLVQSWQAIAAKGLQSWTVSGSHETYLRETPEQCAKVLTDCLEQWFKRTV